MNFRNNFSRLSAEFIRLGQNEKAEVVLDKCVEVMPEKNVPYSYFMLSVAENYYKLGKFEKGNKIMGSLIDLYENDLKYYNSLKGKDVEKVKQDAERAKYILEQIIIMTNQRYKEAGMEKGMKDRFVTLNSLLMNPSAN